MNKTATTRFCLLASLILSLLFPALVRGQGDDGKRMAAIQAVEQMLMGQGNLTSFIEKKLAPDFRASMSEEEMVSQLQDMRKAVIGAGGLDIDLRNDGIHLIFSDGVDATVVMRLADGDSGYIDYLGLQAQKSPDEMTPEEQRAFAQRNRIRAIESIPFLKSDSDFDAFIDEHFSRALLETMNRGSLIESLKSLKPAIASAGTITVEYVSQGIRVRFGGNNFNDVIFSLSDTAPFQFDTFQVNRDVEPAERMANRIKVAPISWDNLEQRLQEEEADGFSGKVLAVKDGDIVMHDVFGLADRDAGRENTKSTIFGIGSIPISFTRSAILRLEDEGLLNYSDPITKFYPDAPADKASMTIEHLMTGRSGLPNFHHIPGEDSNYDLSWIDREEAEKRILNQSLLFEPGTDRVHSHSAFTLLSAIVERVSGKTYAEYLQTTFFDPIGMERTVFYGDDRFAEDQMAVGYGVEAIGDVNIPSNWGPTSWLSMGSGGMASTASDIYKWMQAMHSGEYLSAEAIQKLGRGGFAGGSSDRGFLIMYVNDPDNTVIFMSNNHTDDGDHAMALGRTLLRMVEGAGQ